MDVKTYLKAQWDRAAAWVAAVIGLVALTVGYFGASGTAFTSEQVPYIISGGMFGIFCLGVGATLWLSADLRDEWRKLDEIDEHLTTAIALNVLTPAPAQSNGKPRTRSTAGRASV